MPSAREIEGEARLWDRTLLRLLTSKVRQNSDPKPCPLRVPSRTAWLVLAFVDTAGPKHTNDSQGHAAGNAVIRDVVAAIHTHVRSYDPVVCVGGDEFVCALADCTREEAVDRFRLIVATIQTTQPDASISVGLAALCPEDTLEQLVARGDRARYEINRRCDRLRRDHGLDGHRARR